MDEEDKGAIDTEENPSPAASAPDDNSGAAPVMPPPEDNSGAAPVMPREPQQEPGMAKRIVSYLMGADAAHPASLDDYAARVDPEGKLPQADRNLLAIDHAADQGGPQAAWPLMQANRVAYNAKQSFAKAALTGSPQKPPDLKAAIDAANQAQAHVLDGSNVQFAPSQGGVTATVTMPGTSQPQQIMLTPQAFAQWLDVGGDGQWDKVVDQSVPATLQRLAQAGASAAQPQQSAPSPGMAAVGRPVPKKQPPASPAAPAQQAPQAPAYNPQPQRTKAQITGQAQVSEPGAEPAIPGTHDENGHYLGPQTADKTNYGPELEARSRKIFGEYPSTATEPARQQWMAAQEEKELLRQHDIDVANAKGTNAREVAEIQGGWRYKGQEVGANAKVKSSENYSQAKVQQAQLKLQAEIAREEARDRHSDKLVAMKGLNGMMLSGQFDKMSPQQKQMFDSLTTGQGQGPSQPQQPAQQGAKPKQPAASGNPAPPAPGMVKNGWRFKGGDPSQQQNWERAQ